MYYRYELFKTREYNITILLQDVGVHVFGFLENFTTIYHQPEFELIMHNIKGVWSAHEFVGEIK